MKNKHKLAIQELMGRVQYGLDMRDVDMLAACFASNAEFTMNIAGGDLIGPFENRDGIMKLMTDSMEQQTDQRRHNFSNLFFEAEGDKAAVVISNLTLYGTENGVCRLIATGVYRDSVVRGKDGWQLAYRHLDLDLPY